MVGIIHLNIALKFLLKLYACFSCIILTLGKRYLCVCVYDIL